MQSLKLKHTSSIISVCHVLDEVHYNREFPRVPSFFSLFLSYFGNSCLYIYIFVVFLYIYILIILQPRLDGTISFSCTV